jgi:hypothetical protein
MIVISNTTPLISLSKIGHLEILKKVFGVIYIPPAVYNEVVIRGGKRKGSLEVKKASWIKVQKVKDVLAKQVLAVLLGKGEAETIILGKESSANWVIIDEAMARGVAKETGLRVIGTLGVLVKAKQKGIIKKITPYLEGLVKANFRISPELIKEVLKVSKE